MNRLRLYRHVEKSESECVYLCVCVCMRLVRQCRRQIMKGYFFLIYIFIIIIIINFFLSPPFCPVLISLVLLLFTARHPPRSYLLSDCVPNRHSGEQTDRQTDRQREREHLIASPPSKKKERKKERQDLLCHHG